MAFLQGSRSGLAYVTEVTYGTTPTTPTLTPIPYTSHTLNLAKQRVQGNDIQPDRMQRVDRHGNRTAAGDVVADLRKTDYDAFLESVFMNSWATNVLKVGTTLKSFSIEDQANDTNATDAFRLFTGMSVSKLDVSIRPNQMVTGTFGFVGSDMSTAATSAGTNGALTNFKPFDAYSGTIKIADAGGVLASVATITGVDFSIDNAFNPTFVVGSAITPQLEYGMATVEGTITAYFDDRTLINRFLNETETAFEVQVDSPDAAAGQTWFFPRVKFNAADVPVTGPESRIITIPFVALYDTTEATNVKLTRNT
jgi:hypothetical protein